MPLFYRHSLLAALVAAFLSITPAAAQVDGYYTALAESLESRYGISGGEWVFGSTESAVLALGQLSPGVTAQTFTPAGQPFTRALRLTIAQPSANSWDRTIRFAVQQPIQAGDALLLVAWLRYIWPADGVGLVEPVFEKTTAPYTKSLEEAFQIGGEWQQVMIPFEALESYAAGEARFQLNMGRQRQMVELGGLALINFGGAFAVEELPRETPPQTYGGRDPGAAWRAEAAARIEQHRKGTYRFVVTDAQGAPLEGIRLSVRLKHHAFDFGTAIAESRMLGTTATDRTYREKLADLTGDGRTFNSAVFENGLKWEPWESVQFGTKQQVVGIVDWLRDHGMRVRGHNLVWPGWTYLPADIQQNGANPAYIRERIQSHIAELAGYPGLKGELYEWDVVNEPVHETDLRDVFRGTAGYPTGEEIYTEWFQWAADADPNARLFINEYNILSYNGPDPRDRRRFKEIIGNLIDDGVRLDGIGMQGHMSTPLTPIDTLYKVLEEFAAFGKDISITEYDAGGVEEELGGDYLRDFLTMMFSHPSVSGFLMWGFWDGAHWKQDAPMFRQDWTLKPSGQAFLDLVFGEWWTEETVVTDAEGRAEVRGFAGTYEFQSGSGGEILAPADTLRAGAVREITLTATRTGAEEDSRSKSLELMGSSPEPFITAARIAYTLPAPAPVHLSVYDLNGRLVRTLVDGVQPAGPHSILFNADGLSGGLYVYRLTAGGEVRTGRLTLIR